MQMGNQMIKFAKVIMQDTVYKIGTIYLEVVVLKKY